MVVLVTCKNEADPIKKGALEWSQHYKSILRCSRVANSIISDGILTEFKLNKLLELSFLSARMNMIYSKMKALESSHYFSHKKSMGIFKTFKGS